MRVPKTSPIFDTFHSGLQSNGNDKLINWETSNGSHLPNRLAYTSARYYNNGVLSLLSLI